MDGFNVLKGNPSLYLEPKFKHTSQESSNHALLASKTSECSWEVKQRAHALSGIRYCSWWFRISPL